MPTFYTAKEIAKIMKISYQKALDYVQTSGIAYQKIGRQYRVSVDIFNEFVKNTVITDIL